MPPKRRNKGKHAEVEPPPATKDEEKDPDQENKNDNATASTETNEEETKSNGNNNDAAAHDTANSKPVTPPHPRDRLVLTSGKRRGVYECDYCHSDISQVPRIQCAECPEFDLCLDCFATTDHSAAIARLKARGQVHDAVISTSKSGVSAAAAHHEITHGYRVADSTRYPVFPSVRSVVPMTVSSTPSSVAPIEEDDDKEKEQTQEEGKQGPSQDDDEEYKDEDKEEAEPKTEEKPEAMDIDNDEKKPTPQQESKDKVQEKDQDMLDSSVTEKDSDKSETESPCTELTVTGEDPKSVWTVEEDLRLLDAIETCGMGNWADIAEAIGGNGSANKTPKRCMERYFDDFLGRYGHIVPSYTLVEDETDEEVDDDTASVVDETKSDTDLVRGTKRRRPDRSMFRSQSVLSFSSVRPRKKVKVVPTTSLPGHDKVWPDPYLPPIPNVQVGQDVGRDLTMKAENAFVRTISNAVNKAEADKMRKEYMRTRMNEIHAPKVLPPRADDIAEMPGAELAGYMPRRGDFDMEWDNDAETILADMEFSPNDLPQDRQLKIQVIEIYNAKLDERERRKEFLLSRNLMDYRKNQQADLQLPRDERDLVRRMRLFERFHTPQEHKQFIADLLKAKRLRKEIAKLQMYRRMGIRSLAEAERYELDKSRREYHKFAQLQKEEEVKKAKTARAAAAKEGGAVDGVGPNALVGGDKHGGLASTSSSLWKQYKTYDRKSRRSINRGSSQVTADSSASPPPPNAETATKDDEKSDSEAISNENKSDQEKSSPQEEAAASSETAVVEMKDPSDAKEDADEKVDSKPKSASGGSSFDIVHSRGYELLSSKEVALCEKLHLLPAHYLEIKKALIQESLTRGLLDREGSGSSKRSIVKIDAEKRGDVIDFMVRAGWISTMTGK